jgi:hypothetical protein
VASAEIRECIGRNGSLSRQKAGLSRSTVVTGDVQARISLMAAGRFLTILPFALRFPTGQPDIRVSPVEPQMVEMPVGVVTLKNRTVGPLAQLLGTAIDQLLGGGALFLYAGPVRSLHVDDQLAKGSALDIPGA